MAQSLKDIRRRIKSVENTRQITKAMQMVAAAKLRRAQERAEQARPYSSAIRSALIDLAAQAGNLRHPFLTARPVRSSGYVVVSADRGLAGPYNTNILRASAQHMRERDPRVVAVGRKGRDYFLRRHYQLAETFVGIGDDPTFAQANDIAQVAMRMYLEGHVDEVYLAYNQFINAMQHKPTLIRLLPVATGDLPAAGTRQSIEFEPDAESVLAKLLPHYVVTLVFMALLDAKAAEHGARMTAMDSATKNASEMIDNLVLLRNRVRQAAITKEIAELVGGAEALQQA